MTAEALYQEALLRLARGAAAVARLGNPDATARRDNPLCGDDVTVDVRVRDGRLVEIGHQVRGCVLCQAAMAVVRAAAPGRTRDEISAARAALAAMLREGGAMPAGPWEELGAFLPVRDVPSRYTCVLLPFDTLADAMSRQARPQAASAGVPHG